MDRAHEFLSLRFIEPGSEHLAPKPHSRHRLGKGSGNDHVIEFIDHFVAHVGSPQPPGGNVGNFQFLAKHDRRQRRQERQHGARFDQPGAERVDDDNLAVAYRLDEAGHAEAGGGVELQRIGEIGVDAPQQHFSAAQTGDRSDKHAVVAHDQILAFDQQESEIAREIRVLEIGLVHWPGREQANPCVLLTIEREQLSLKRLIKRRDAFDPRGAVDVGNSPRQGKAILDRETGTGRRLGTIGKNPPAAVGATPDVDRIKAQVRAAGRRHADERPQELGITGDQGGRQCALHA